MAIAVGLLVGFVDRTRPKFSAGVALIPWIIVNLAGLHWRQACEACLGGDLALNAAYPGIGILAAHYCGKLVHRRGGTALVQWSASPKVLDQDDYAGDAAMEAIGIGDYPRRHRRMDRFLYCAVGCSGSRLVDIPMTYLLAPLSAARGPVLWGSARRK